MTDITGMRKGSAGISCDMSPEYGELSAVDRDGSESVYQINLKNLNVPGGEKEVLFAVWEMKEDKMTLSGIQQKKWDNMITV